VGRIRNLTHMSLDGLIELDGGVALRLRHDELGELVAERLATAGAIILAAAHTRAGPRPRARAVLRTRD